MFEGKLIFNEMNRLGAERIPYFFMIDFLKEKGEVISLDNLTNEIQFEINSAKKKLISQKVELTKYPISIQEYEQIFSKVRKNLLLGNSYLVNLTLPTRIDIELSLDEIYNYSNAKFKLKYKNDFVCFSPERFVGISNQKIFSNPMKGTIDASIPNAKKRILENEKEAAEHATIVDLIRNDLSLVSENVEVKNYRYIDQIETSDKTLLQVSSEISGDLPRDYHTQLGTIFNKLLPAGSICGAPKKKTIEIIKEAENYSRKFYTGIFGVFDGENVDSAVMIRFIEKDGSKLYFKSGGGVTAKSDVNDEYKELIQKIYVPIY